MKFCLYPPPLTLQPLGCMYKFLRNENPVQQLYLKTIYIVCMLSVENTVYIIPIDHYINKSRFKKTGRESFLTK